MILSAAVCMSARMRTAPICACCDACARITSVDMRTNAVVVHIAPVGVCCDALCACAASVSACCDDAFARTAFVRALCAALNAPSLSVCATVLPLRVLPTLVLTAMFFIRVMRLSVRADAACECTMSLATLPARAQRLWRGVGAAMLPLSTLSLFVCAMMLLVCAIIAHNH
jgi:hypothetical protein